MGTEILDVVELVSLVGLVCVFDLPFLVNRLVHWNGSPSHLQLAGNLTSLYLSEA